MSKNILIFVSLALTFSSHPTPTKEEKAKQQPSEDQLKKANEKLILGILTNNINLVKEALSKGAVIDKRYPYPGGDPIIRAMYTTVSAIELAIVLDRPEILKDLIQKSDFLQSHKDRSDRLLAIAKSPQVVDILVAAGLDVNSNKHGVLPLELAVHFGAPAEVVQALLHHGAKVNDSGMTEGIPPLWAAITFNAIPEVVDVLIKGGADVNYKDENGNFLLDIALQEQKKAQKNDDMLRRIQLNHIISLLKKANAQSKATSQ